MPIPSISITIQSNGLGQLPASSANVAAKVGICSQGTPNTLYVVADKDGAQSSLGVGPLVEHSVESLVVAGGQVVAVPITPSTAGTASAVDATLATGAGVLTVTKAPIKTIDVKIVTGGSLGTMTAQFRLNGGAYGPIITSTASAWSYLVPGTLTTLTFSAQTYTAAAVWTIATTGAISLVGTGTAGWVTQVSSPMDAFAVKVTIVGGGALGAGLFTVSADGGNTTGGQVLIPSGGLYAIPGTGLVLNFSAATYVLADIYSFTSTSASFGTSDVTTAVTALLADSTEWFNCHIIGMGASAAAAASLAAVVDAQAVIAEAAFRYCYFSIECPTVEVDVTIATAFASFVSARTMVCVGDIGHQSYISGLRVRRNCGIAVCSRLALIPPSEHPGDVSRGALPSVKSLYPNFGATSWSPSYLDGQRFTTLRTWVKKRGYYVTRGNMMAENGSDFASVMNRRVMDVACGFAYLALLEVVNDKLPVNDAGTIYAPAAAQIEKFVANQITVGLDGNATNVMVSVSKTEQILTTKRLPVSIGIRPFGYAEDIRATIGFVNPALTT